MSDAHAILTALTNFKILNALNQYTGFHIQLFACSGYGQIVQQHLAGLYRLHHAGFYIRNPEIICRRYARFAGSDDARLDDFNNLCTLPTHTLPDILLAIRGGYGSMRLLPRFDDQAWQQLAEQLKAKGTMLVGFSDVTAIQLALLCRGMPSVSGAMLYGDFSHPDLMLDSPPHHTLASFVKICQQPSLCITVTQDNGSSPSLPNSLPLCIKGTFWGGNLSVLTALVGTPYLPNIQNGILFLEDVGESAYRIERLLYTLYLSGILSGQQAIVLGDFGSVPEDGYDRDYNLETVIAHFRQLTGLPIFTHFPFGHGDARTNFPLGVAATLTSQPDGSYQVQFDNPFAMITHPHYANMDWDKLYLASDKLGLIHH